MADKTPADRTEFLREKIEKNTFKDQPKEFKDQILDSLKRIALGELPQRHIDAVNSLRKELETFMLIGKAANLLCGRIEEYVDWASRASSADYFPARQTQTQKSTVREQPQQDDSVEDDEGFRRHWRAGQSENERLNALGEIQQRKWTGAPLSELVAQRVSIMVRGRPILRMPESAESHPTFLSWWFAVGRPEVPSGWSTLSGPWVNRGRVEVISEQEWESLNPQDRERLTRWAANLPIGMFYD